ncbi:MAG: UDP-N-acetylglucosamine 1-carboxyvinyltransferase, partial [Clostridia bacterium]|nr:UDP-N-acetylglucosamine 1-carboxyvinyltransferase [Clostridia bacterium]
MDKLVVCGGRPLEGTLAVSGMKNAAVAVVLATVLVEDKCVLENLPDIADVNIALDILAAMGATVNRISRDVVEIDTTFVKVGSAPRELASRMRASYYLVGSELGRFGRSHVAAPGGCDFGVRPIDLHIKGFSALGATVNVEGGYIEATTPEGGLVGNSVYLDLVSVGATINTMLAAVRAKGLTVIENAAHEPHIVDTANFLNACGADISGAGTDVIKIRGVERLHGVTYTIIPDMIEAGTFMVLAAATKSKLKISGIIPKHVDSISAKLTEMGAKITEEDEAVIVEYQGPLKRINIKTLPYPGFPTDMNPQMCVLLCLAEGTSIISEGVWDNRFRYTEELRRMGASIKVDGRVAVVEGTGELKSARVRALDLRAGAAMVVAALAAPGRTEIEDIYHIQRGYENLVEKLRGVGADI